MANVMIQGTTSSAGKSIICTALCRIFKQDGYKPCPFKSQNMSSKYYLTEDGMKMSTAQALQAFASGLKPTPYMNPILLVPETDMGSMVVIKGRDKEHMKAREYFKFKGKLKSMIKKVYNEIENKSDIVVMEGAGSPAEINLNQNDIVNMGMANIVDSDVFLVADIDRGGVFASFYGTVMLLDPDERKRIKGLIINKFRGDKTLLDPGIEMIEKLLDIPVIGTIPYIHLELPDEDSLQDYEKQCDELSEFNGSLDTEINRLASIVRKNIDMDYIYDLIFKN